MKIMINFDDIAGENTQQHNPHWLQIPNHRYRILIQAALDQEKQIHYSI